MNTPDAISRYHNTDWNVSIPRNITYPIDVQYYDENHRQVFFIYPRLDMLGHPIFDHSIIFGGLNLY